LIIRYSLRLYFSALSCGLFFDAGAELGLRLRLKVDQLSAHTCVLSVEISNSYSSTYINLHCKSYFINNIYLITATHPVKKLQFISWSQRVITVFAKLRHPTLNYLILSSPSNHLSDVILSSKPEFPIWPPSLQSTPNKILHAFIIFLMRSANPHV
jgi:hypothetical protein